MNLIANSDKTLEKVLEDIRGMYLKDRYVRVKATTKRNRSLDQNALWPVMYLRISETLGDGSAADIAHHRAYCKLMIGVPILRRDDAQFELGWKRYFAMRSYEEQLFLMGPNQLFGVDGFPVTRLFDTKQGAEYTNEIAVHYAPHGVFFGDLLSD